MSRAVRASVTYVAIVGIDLAFFLAMAGGPTQLSVAATAVWMILAAVLLLPPVPLTIALIGRLSDGTTRSRAVAGVLAWAGWSVFVGACLMLLSRVVLDDRFGAAVAILAVSGAAFGVVGLAADSRRGRALTITSILVVVAVVIGSITMSGRWGAAT
jgi:hypothetical protein